MLGAGRYWPTCSDTVRTGWPELSPVNFLMLPRAKTPQLLWASCLNIQWFSQGKIMVSVEFLVLSFVPIDPDPVPGWHWETSHSIFLNILHQISAYLDEIPHFSIIFETLKHIFCSGMLEQKHWWDGYFAITSSLNDVVFLNNNKSLTTLSWVICPNECSSKWLTNVEPGQAPLT